MCKVVNYWLKCKLALHAIYLQEVWKFSTTHSPIRHRREHPIDRVNSYNWFTFTLLFSTVLVMANIISICSKIIKNQVLREVRASKALTWQWILHIKFEISLLETD